MQQKIKINSTLNKLSSSTINKIIDDIDQLASSKFHLKNCWSCLYVAEFVTTTLIEKGITDFTVIEWYVITKESRRQEDNWIDIRHQHTWVELNDWTKIDPSVVQFDEFDWIEIIDWEENRSIKSIYTPKNYLKAMEKEKLDYSDKRFIK